MGAVQGFNGPPSPAKARETLLNTPLRVTALSQPQPEHGSAPSRGRPIVPRARLQKPRAPPAFPRPRPRIPLPSSSGRPILSTSTVPANHAGPESRLWPTLLPALSRSVLKAFTRPIQSAAGSRLPHPNLPPSDQSARLIPLPAQPTRALKLAGEWAQGGPSTLTAWPIGDSAWPRRQPIDMERGAAAERSGPNIPPPSSLPLSPSLRAAVHLPPPFLLSPSATRAPAAL